MSFKGFVGIHHELCEGPSMGSKVVHLNLERETETPGWWDCRRVRGGSGGREVRISVLRPEEADHSSLWNELKILVLGRNRAWVFCEELLEQL